MKSSLKILYMVLIVSAITMLAVLTACTIGSISASNNGNGNSVNTSSSSNSSSSSSLGTSSAPSAIVGTWVCTNAGTSASYAGETNEYIFTADSIFTEIINGNTNQTANYSFNGSNLILYSTSFTNFQNAFIDTNGYLYFNPGNVFQLISGSGWDGTYQYQNWGSYNNNGTNIFQTNFLTLTLTTSNVSVVNQTNLIYTNNYGPYINNQENGAPTNGTVISWYANSGNPWWISINGSFFYFFEDGNYILTSSYTNIISLIGCQYYKAP